MRNILLLRLSSMGDVIITAPLLAYLRDRHSGCSITLVTGADYAPLFADDPRLAHVEGIGARDERLPSALYDATWDLAVDLQNSRRSRALLRGIDAVRKGRFDKLHWQRLLLLLFRCDTYGSRCGVAGRYIDAAAENPARESVPPLRLYFRDSRRKKTQARYLPPAGNIGRPLLALFPFSAWKNKEWPAENYIAVARYFLIKGWMPVIFGGMADREKALIMESQIGTRCLSLAGKLSLSECGALLSDFSLALGNDTGLSHLARSCGVRTGIFFGPTTRHFGFFPWGDPAFKVFETPLSCRPCHAHGGNRCLRFTHACMRKIGTEQVITALEGLLEAPPNSVS